MSKDKIVLLGTAHPYRGGLASFNERLAEEFIANGYEFIIYTFTLQYPDFLFPGKTQYAESPKPKNLVIERKINAINPFNWLKVGFELKKLKPKLIISKFWIPFIGPFTSILVGPFIGAVIGEKIGGQANEVALKSGFGSFLGFLMGVGIKIGVSLVFLVYFFKLVIFG